MKYYAIVFSLILFASCTKFENKNRTIKGQIVDSVSTPIGNKSYLLIITSTNSSIGAGNGITDEKLYQFNTDANGNFSAIFQAGKKDVANISLSKETNDNTFYWGREVAKDLEINTGVVILPRR